MSELKEKDKLPKKVSPKIEKKHRALQEAVKCPRPRFALHKEPKRNATPVQAKPHPPVISTIKTSYAPPKDPNDENG